MVRVIYFSWVCGLFLYCRVRTVFPFALTCLRKLWLIGSFFPSLSSNGMILWMKISWSNQILMVMWQATWSTGEFAAKVSFSILAFLKMTTGICKVIRLKWMNNVIIKFSTKLGNICYFKLHCLDFLYGIGWRTDHQLSACAFIKPTI